ncbi:hypothetical protein P5673_018359 [Acropora cervicornis]|uniref:Uncharacterized protein n=1 Tax=Acropora cervicornis TaxID=6130 RepID=A0AAD9V3C8_ACRCE|nr:hypothetical protein P5673_018359 [Acropora cervicornis]
MQATSREIEKKKTKQNNETRVFPCGRFGIFFRTTVGDSSVEQTISDKMCYFTHKDREFSDWKMKFSVVFLLMLASFCVTTAKAGVFFNERPETDAGKDGDKLQFFQEEIHYPCKCIDGTEGYWFNNTCPKDTSQCNINPLCTLKCCSY